MESQHHPKLLQQWMRWRGGINIPQGRGGTIVSAQINERAENLKETLTTDRNAQDIYGNVREELEGALAIQTDRASEALSRSIGDCRPDQPTSIMQP